MDLTACFQINWKFLNKESVNTLFIKPKGWGYISSILKLVIYKC